MSIRHHLALALSATLLSPAALRAADREPGVYWEQTVEVQMQGMNMPAQTQKVCLPKKGLEEPPQPGPGQDDRCQVSDLQRSGQKMTWKLRCTGEQAMTGEGELVHAKDSYSGKMDMHMPQGDMTMKLRGKRLGGDCDAGAMKRKVAALQEQQAQAQADGEEQMDRLCDEAVEEMEVRQFGGGPVVICKKPAQVARLCAHVATRAGYAAYKAQAERDEEAPRIVRQLCKKDPDTARAGLCARAAQEASGDSTPDDVLDFLGNHCPDEARAVAKKECAGRKFTGIPPGMRRVCVKYAQDELKKSKAQPGEDAEAQDEAPSSQGSAKEKAKEAGKKLLKGLF